MSLIPYQTYKLTNLQWIERVPCHWELKALKHCIARLGSGGTPESGNPDYWTDEDDEEGVPWVSIGDMTTSPIVKSTQKRITRSGLASKGLEIFPVGSLLYSIYASLGKVATLGIDATFNQAILAIVPDETTVSQSYLCYWLQSLEAHLAYYASSNTQANLNAAKVLSYPVALPSQEEQLAIASFLDRETAKIHALIAEQQRLIELLQEKRQAVISHAVTKGLNPNAPMKDSGVEWLGEVPEHWGVRRLRHIGTLQNGLNIGGDAFGEGDPFISYGDVYKNPNVPQKPEGLVRSTPEDKQKYGLERGDVLFTRTSETVDDIGVASTCLEQIPQSTFAGFLIRLRPFKGVLEPRYSTHLFRNQGVKTHFAGTMNMVTRASLSQGELGNLAICLPPLDEQLKIASAIEEMAGRSDQLISSAWELVALLRERRSALISAAVTGQIDVRGLAEAEGNEQ